MVGARVLIGAQVSAPEGEAPLRLQQRLSGEGGVGTIRGSGERSKRVTSVPLVEELAPLVLPAARRHHGPNYQKIARGPQRDRTTEKTRLPGSVFPSHEAAFVLNPPCAPG